MATNWLLLKIFVRWNEWQHRPSIVILDITLVLEYTRSCYCTVGINYYTEIVFHVSFWLIITFLFEPDQDESSSFAQIIPLGEACTRFLEAQLDPCNCIGMREFAEAHVLGELFKVASTMIMDKFADIVVVRLWFSFKRNQIFRVVAFFGELFL